MEKIDSINYINITDSALLLLNFFNIIPANRSNHEKMYRLILKLIHRGDIPFKKQNKRYYLNKADIEILRAKIKKEIEISGSFFEGQTPKNKPESSVESSIEKIVNIIELHNDKTISAKHALIIINKIIKNHKIT